MILVVHLWGRTIGTHYIVHQCVTDRRGRWFLSLCIHARVRVYVPTSQSTQPTHLHGLLQVLSGCTEAVEGEVLHNRVDPLTSRGHHTKSLPLYLTAVNMNTINNQNWWWIVAAVGLPWGHIYMCAHTCAYVCMYMSVVWLDI